MRRGLQRAAWLLFVCALFIVTGCSQGLAFQGEPNAEIQDVCVGVQKLAVLYYSTKEHDYLVPVRARVNAGDHFARHVVEKLVGGPEDRELLASPFPSGLLVRDVYIRNGIACVDLGGDMESIAFDDKWQRAMDSLALTLTDFSEPRVQAVEILINGTETDALFERPGYVNPVIQDNNSDAKTATLYFSYNDTYLIPVTISVANKAADSTAFTLQHLIAGPQGMPNLSRVFAEGTKLLSYQQEGDLVRLNFSREAIERDTRGNIRRDEQSPTLWALGMTLRDIPGIRRFQIYIEGKALPDLSCPIAVPANYLDNEWMSPLLGVSG